MAIDAVAHFEITHLLDNFHVRHVAVARRAGNPVLNMRRVYELNVIGNPVHPDPIDGLRITTFVEEFCELHGCGIAVRSRTVNLAEVMAEQALSDRRNRRCLVGTHLAVAELAVDTCFRYVRGVWECNGLRGAIAEAENRRRGTPPRLENEITDHCDDQRDAEPNHGHHNFDESVVVHDLGADADRRRYCAPR